MDLLAAIFPPLNRACFRTTPELVLLFVKEGGCWEEGEEEAILAEDGDFETPVNEWSFAEIIFELAVFDDRARISFLSSVNVVVS